MTSTTPPPVDRIIVRGLVVEAFIGVFDHERLARQRVRFDIEVETVPEYRTIVRDEGRYVSYADLVEYIETRAGSDEHVELVETWADDVADMALQNPLATRVHVTVQKIDVFDAAAGVGVSITRDAVR